MFVSIQSTLIDALWFVFVICLRPIYAKICTNTQILFSLSFIIPPLLNYKKIFALWKIVTGLLHKYKPNHSLFQTLFVYILCLLYTQSTDVSPAANVAPIPSIISSNQPHPAPLSSDNISADAQRIRRLQLRQERRRLRQNNNNNNDNDNADANQNVRSIFFFALPLFYEHSSYNRMQSLYQMMITHQLIMTMKTTTMTMMRKKKKIKRLQITMVTIIIIITMAIAIKLNKIDLFWIFYSSRRHLIIIMDRLSISISHRVETRRIYSIYSVN